MRKHMARGKTKARAALVGWIRPLARHGFGKPVALTARLALCYALVTATMPASAQVPPPVTVPNAVTGNTTLTGTLNGNGGPGYFVTNGATLTINNGLLQNFTTSGGSGSGGGLGAGGAIFIDTGGTVVLNNTSFSHNTAIGGTGGTSSPYGGNLNNISPVVPPDGTPNGANGVNGVLAPDNEFIFGDGRGNGTAGIGVTAGGNAINGVGGIGGIGGPGGNGWISNPVAEANNDIAIAQIASTASIEAGEAAIVITFVAGAIAEYGSSANPFEDPLAPITGITSTLLAAVNGLNLAGDTIGLADAIATQQLTQGALNSWNMLVSKGLAGGGGAGQTGGAGGAGSYGFGGGAGGQGGAYGLSANSTAPDGVGGNGGVGGAGGFGGGGGAGGYGFGACQNGNGPNQTGCTSTSGVAGLGGTPGFGGGVGSTGGVTAISLATGGGGGSAYGGSIFINAGASLTITGNATFSGNNAIGGASLNGGLAGGAAGTDLFMMTGSTVNIAPGAGNFVIFNGTIADNSKSSIGTPSFPLAATYPVSGGAGVNIYAGTTIFNGNNTYSGETVIVGGAFGGPLNPGTNTPGAPNYALTDGALQAADGVGLPTTSNLNFSGPGQFTGGVLQIPGTVLSNGVVMPTTFSRFVSANPNPDGGSNPGFVQWTGSGGFAAINAPLTVTLSGGQALAWGVNGFVPFGYSLMFGSATSNSMVTFTNAIDISGGTLAGGTAASILVANNGTPAGSIATMSGIISGNGDLSIGGGGFNGTLNLTAVNTYTGLTFVDSGTLALSGAGSIASSSGLVLSNVGGLDISQTTAGATIPNLNGAGTVFLGGQELTVANGGNFSGVLTDGGAGGGTKGSLIVAGGTLTLLGTNTYTGDTTINPGATLALFGNGSISNSSPVIANGIFDISQVAVGTMIQSLAGSGQALIGSNFLVITNGSTTFSGDINDGGIGGGTGGSLMVTGGVQTLSGVNTYTGITFIQPVAPSSTATLALSGLGSIATSSAVAIGTNGTFDISQTTTGASIQRLLGTGTVALGGKTLTITNASTTFDGTIADGGIGGGVGGNLVISGGTQTLSGTNTYTGTTTIDPTATLALFNGGSIATSSNVIDNGTFDISQTALGAAIMTLSGNGTVALGGRFLNITAGSTTFSGQITDGGLGGGTGGTFAVTGGTQTLSGVNTYTGPTLVGTGATLALSGIGSIAKSAFVDVVGTFDISQTTAGASIITLEGNGKVALGGQELTITNGSTTFFGNLADGGIGGGTKGSLIVSGGTQTLAGFNTYTGDTTIAPNPVGGNATLALIGDGSIATSSVVAIATGGTFDISQTAAGAAITTLADAGGGSPFGRVALGAQTLFITNGSTTFSGVISDGGIGGGTGGNLEITGGTQTLAGVNTYTGLTAIIPVPSAGTATLALAGNGSIATSSELYIADHGTFDISQTLAGASIKTLFGTGSVVLGNQILTITAGAAGPTGTNPAGIYDGVISGAGGFAITGGHEELYGVNTYLGGTTISGGAILSVNNSNSLGANTSLLTINNGDLVVDGSITIPQPIKLIGAPPGTDLIDLGFNNVTLSGAISGPGVLTVIDGGSLNLTGTTSGIGGIVLGPGVTFTASPSASAGLGTTPITLVSPGGSSVNLFTGSVHVVGTLDVFNGQPPELFVVSGATVVGVGSINATVLVEAGGAIAPGDGAGTIVINAPVINLPGSTYSVDIDGPTASTNCVNPTGCAGEYSSVRVTGSNTYTANGTIVPVMRGIGAPANNNYTAPVTTSFLVVYAPGGVLGSFTSLTQPAVGAGLAKGTRFDALYYNALATPGTTSAINYAENAAGNPNAVALWVTPSSYQNLSPWNVSLTQNQNQVALGLDALRGVNDLNPALNLPAGLKNNPQGTWIFGQLFPQQPANLPGIFNTLSGEVATDAKQVAFQTTTQFLEFMLDSSANGRKFGGSALAFAPTPDALPAAADAAPDTALDFASNTVKAPRAPAFEQRWSAWGSAFGGGLNANGDPVVGSSSVSARMYGLGGGMDYRLSPDSVVGFALAGGAGSWNLAQGLGNGRTDFFQGGVYGTRYFGPAYLAAAVSVTNHWMTTDRYAFAADHLQASFDGLSYGGRVEAGWRYMMPTVAVTPYLAGEIQRFSTPSYSETDLVGGGFGLQFNRAGTTEARGEAGARFDSIFAVNADTSLILHARGAWAYQKVTDPGMVAMFEAALLPGALPGAGVGFTVNGAVIPTSLGLASAGAELRFSNNWSLLGNFNGEFGTGGQSYTGNGTVRYTW